LFQLDTDHLARKSFFYFLPQKKDVFGNIKRNIETGVLSSLCDLQYLFDKNFLLAERVVHFFEMLPDFLKLILIKDLG